MQTAGSIPAFPGAGVRFADGAESVKHCQTWHSTDEASDELHTLARRMRSASERGLLMNDTPVSPAQAKMERADRGASA